MLVEFDEEFELPVEAVYPYFQSPADWPRLFKAFGEVADVGGGWYAVPLRGFPFPLVAKMTSNEPLASVQWVFRGFWRGEGQVSFSRTDRGVAVRGYERISPRPLLWLAPVVERPFLERRFQRVWASGWRRLRLQEKGAWTERSDSRP